MDEVVLGKGRFRRVIEDFSCEHCGFEVNGTGFTDHCPKCLWSKHVDKMPGDRMSRCGGGMEPVSVAHDRKSYVITYRCAACRFEKRMKAAEEDDLTALSELAGRI